MTNLNTRTDDSTPAAISAVLASHASSLVDAIGQLKAEIAPVLAKLKALEAGLKSHGPGRYLGERYEATINTHERDVLDMVAVRIKLSEKWIEKHTSTTEVTVLKVTARVLP